MIGAIALVLLAGLAVRRGLAGCIDPFEPLVVFLAMWTVMFVLRPATMLFSNDYALRDTYSARSGFFEAEVLALVGAVTFLVGYLAVPILRKNTRWHSKASAAWSHPRALAPTVARQREQLLLRVSVIFGAIGLFTMLHSFAQARGTTSNESGYLSFAPLLLVPASLIWRDLDLPYRKLLRASAYLAVVLLTADYWLVGERFAGLLPLASMAIYEYLSHYRRPKSVTLALTVIALVFLLSVLVNARPGVRTTTAIGATGVANFLLNDTTAEMPAFALMLETQGSVWHITPGYLPYSVAIHWVPRQLWPNKPESSDEVLYAKYFPGSYAVAKNGTEFSVLGDFYYDSGVIGIVAGMFLLGGVLRWCYDHYMTVRRHRLAPVAYSMIPPLLVMVFRGDLTLSFALVLYSFLPIWVAGWLLHRFARAGSVGRQSARRGARAAGSGLPLRRGVAFGVTPVRARRGRGGRVHGAVRRLRAESAMSGTVVSGFWIQGLTVISGALVARMLGVSGRGELALILVITLLVTQIGSLGLPQAAVYWGSRDPGATRALVRFLVPRLLILGAVLVVIQISAMIVALHGRPVNVRDAGFLSLVAVPAVLAQQLALALLQAQGRFNHFNVIRTLPSTAYGLGILALYESGGGNVFAVTAVWAAGFVLVAAVGLLVGTRDLADTNPPRVPLSFRQMVSFGIRGLLGATSPIDTFNLDQAIVGLVLSSQALGLYVAAVAFTNFPRVIAQNIGLVTFPKVAAEAEPTVAMQLLRRYVVMASVLCGVIVVGLEVIMVPLVRIFYGAAFDGSIGLGRILLVSAWLAGIRRVLSDGARGFGLPGVGTIAETSSWVVLMVVLPPLIALDGVQGVAISLNVAGIGGLVGWAVAFRRGRRRAATLPGTDAQPPSLTEDRELATTGAETL